VGGVTPDPTPIVCGVDFSPDARRALHCAAVMAERLSCPLRLVSAVEPLLVEAAVLRGAAEAFTAQVRRDLNDLVPALPVAPTEVSVHVEPGEAAPVLLRAAIAANSPFVVVGSRGLGRAARFFLGSTTLRLLRATDRPVLAVPSPEDESTQEWPGAHWPATSHVCSGVDFSEGSLAAVEAAARLAERLGATLTLVHAVSEVAVPVGWEEAVRAADRDRLAQAESHLREIARKLAPGAAVSASLGTPADVLAAAVDGHPATLIAVGLRGAGHHRPGSTAMRVLATARVPVLAVPE
jgi:nucleotide-binding universal stress UspA family protein